MSSEKKREAPSLKKVRFVQLGSSENMTDEEKPRE